MDTGLCVFGKDAHYRLRLFTLVVLISPPASLLDLQMGTVSLSPLLWHPHPRCLPLFITPVIVDQGPYMTSLNLNYFFKSTFILQIKVYSEVYIGVQSVNIQIFGEPNYAHIMKEFVKQFMLIMLTIFFFWLAMIFSTIN